MVIINTKKILIKHAGDVKNGTFQIVGKSLSGCFGVTDTM